MNVVLNGFQIIMLVDLVLFQDSLKNKPVKANIQKIRSLEWSKPSAPRIYKLFLNLHSVDIPLCLAIDEIVRNWNCEKLVSFRSQSFTIRTVSLNSPQIQDYINPSEKHLSAQDVLKWIFFSFRILFQVEDHQMEDRNVNILAYVDICRYSLYFYIFLKLKSDKIQISYIHI